MGTGVIKHIIISLLLYLFLSLEYTELKKDIERLRVYSINKCKIEKSL